MGRVGLTIFLLLSAASVFSQDFSFKIHPWVMDRTANGKSAEFFVVMQHQADVSAAHFLKTKEEKGLYVYTVLTETARRSQAPLQRWLRKQRIPYQSFWIVNEILIKGGDRNLALKLARRFDVDRIEGNPVIHNNLPDREPLGPEAALAIEWNVTKMNSPGVWALGYNGQNIVVGGQDTGYRWTHNFIKPHYRGWNGVTADHNYNWHDSIHSGGGICGANTIAPCDDHGHGTHTMGSAVGDDGGANQVGNAPGAKWIGCRNMDQGNGTPATYTECFQWFLAPTKIDGTGADPTKAPHITTNSWGCPASEGCAWNTLQTAVDNQKAAGIITVVAAGNSGPACDTVLDPPAMYGSAFTVGSTTNSVNNNLSGFSSRGEGAGSGLMKPNIMGPGSGVRSAWNGADTQTNTISGTSMATPNVAGAITTVLSGHACYIGKQDNVELLFDRTATRIPTTVEACGGDYTANGTLPNNSWGYGLANALKAFKSAGPPVGDGWPGHGGGAAAQFTKSGTNVTASWDSAACAGMTALILYGSIGDYSAYTGSADCNAGNAGTKTFAPPGGNVWFNIVWANVPAVALPQGIAGHPGFASSGARTLDPAAANLCNIVCSDIADSNCD
jgi:hypothetical protein